MPDPHWENLQQIFHAAIALAPHERADYLNEACDGDLTLRQAVESLLKSHEETDNFVDTPAYQAAAEMLLDDEDLKSGQTISHYRILSLLGEGGMGKVYLTEDTKLKRKVALKVLATGNSGNDEACRRLLREAQAAAALDHPNICAIYEVDQESDRSYIGMQYIEGETLEARMAIQRLSLNDSLNIASQIADALAEAHAHNIIHRDIKPSNIMLTSRGQVKVLDFGLAKTASAALIGPNEAETKRMSSTPGIILGTVPYMSPEQLRGESVDLRTDIFSFGVVVYEMLSGRRAFACDSDAETIGAILHQQPRELLSIDPTIPKVMEDIVGRCLAKDSEQRYQNMHQVVRDLNAARNDEVDPAEAAAEPTAEVAHTNFRKTAFGVVLTARPTSGRQYLTSKIKRHKRGVVVALGAVIIAIAALSVGWHKFARGGQLGLKPAAPFQTMKITRLTSTGKSTVAAISPDGKYVVHAVDDGARQSLWMRQVTNFSNVQIVPPADVEYGGLTFSPDGNYIYYVASEKNAESALYQMPVLGGTSRRLLTDIDTRITFSPDGKQFAFARGYPEQTELALMVASADGTQERILATRRDARGGPWEPAWSPDGKVIVSGSGSMCANGYISVVEVRTDDGAVRQITSKCWWKIGQMAWLKDGHGLIMTASEQESSPSQIWFLSYPDGETHRITNDLTDYVSVGLTADSTALVAVQAATFSNVWVAPNGDASRAVQITFSKFDGSGGLSWTPQSRIVFESSASGDSELWIVDADGNNATELTAGEGHNVHPVVSPDGTHIIFHSNRAGHNNIWRMDIDGRNLKQLTNGPGEQLPDCSPDGKWVVYNSVAPSKHLLWKVPFDGGEAVQLTDRASFMPMVSPDGKLIACYYNDDGWKAAVIPFKGGRPTQTFDISVPFSWTPDGHALAYVDRRNLSSIWSVSVTGGLPKLLTDFKAGRIFNFAWSRDGKHLALARGDTTSDVVLIRNF